MRPPGGLGQSVACRAGEHALDCRQQAYPMADRHEDRRDASAGTEHRTDDLFVIDQRNPCALLRLAPGRARPSAGSSRPRWWECPSTSPRWLANPQRRGCAMPCPSHSRTSGGTPRGHSASSTTGISRNDSRPGHVRKRHRHLRDGVVQELEAGKREYRHCGARAALHETDIHTPHAVHDRRLAGTDHAHGELTLQRDRCHAAKDPRND